MLPVGSEVDIVSKFNKLSSKKLIEEEVIRLYNDMNYGDEINSFKDIKNNFLNILKDISDYKITYGLIDINSRYPKNSVSIGNRILMGDVDTKKKILDSNKDHSMASEFFYNGYSSYENLLLEIDNSIMNNIRYNANSALNIELDRIFDIIYNDNNSSMLINLNNCLVLLSDSKNQKDVSRLIDYNKKLNDVMKFEEVIDCLSRIVYCFSKIDCIMDSKYLSDVSSLIDILQDELLNIKNNIDMSFVNDYVSKCLDYYRVSSEIDDLTTTNNTPVSTGKLLEYKNKIKILSDELNDLVNILGLSSEL